MATVMTEGGTGGGGWAAIARKEAPVEKKPDIQSLLSTAGLKTVVVDANALIGGGIRLPGIADQYFTVKEVLAEIRDPTSRFHVATLPVEIRCLEPSEEALTKVAQFARATGDVQSLSDVDLKVIALTYTLEAQVHGTDHIRIRPPPLVLTPAKVGRLARDPPGWGIVANPEEWAGIENEGDGANIGSRILGLKSLPSNTWESTLASDSYPADPSSATEVNVNFTVLHNPEGNGSTLVEVGELDSVVSENHEETSHAAVEITQTESLQEVDGNKISNTPAVPPKPAESKQISKGEGDADDDEWQKAVSRSTRRQYLKRAQRRARRQQLAESSAAGEAPDTGNYESIGVKSVEEHSDEGSAHGSASLRPGVSAGVDDAQLEGQLAFSGSDRMVDSTELTGEGLYEHDTGIDGAESFDDESSHHEDTGSHEDAASSVVDTEQSWSVNPLWTSSVACMTGDYAMQNVILQMGLRLLSSSGQHIKELNNADASPHCACNKCGCRWVLKCQACFKVTTETERLFCPKCGNGGTLFKVSITVGPNGCVVAGRNRRPILRGTRYSLPVPKGGREGALINPILREDQLPAKPRKVKKPEFEAFSSSDVVFAHPHEKKGQKSAGVKAAAAIFSGRRNPNERRRSHK